jgi:transketolase
MNENEQERLKRVAAKLRERVIDMTTDVNSGHPSSCFSCAEIITALYFSEMTVDVGNPQWPDRDRFILSKGHAAPILYAALIEKGFLPENELLTLRKLDSRLQGHPVLGKTPGVDSTTGSLGQGLSAAVGMALVAKRDRKDYVTYVLLGDGELGEGQVWEAAMSAGHYELDNLIAILDRNYFQSDGNTEDIMKLEPLREKWEAFNWEVTEIDGQDLEECVAALQLARRNRDRKPKLIIAQTKKGWGCSMMGDDLSWHGKPLTCEQAVKAKQEIEEALG